MSNIAPDDTENKQPDPDKITDRRYRAKVDTIAYAEPARAAMIQVRADDVIIGRPSYVEGWIAWIDDGEVQGHIRLSDLELQP